MASLEQARDVLASKLHTLAPGAKSHAPAGAAAKPQPAPHVPADPYRGAVKPEVTRHPQLTELPRKRIVTLSQLHHFEHTQAFGEILGLIRECNDHIRGRWLTDDMDLSPSAAAILGVVNSIEQLVNDTPRDNNSAAQSRFGNPAFRTLYERITAAVDDLQQQIPGLRDSDGELEYQRRLRQELAPYLYESWGNAKRIDYGSGMELSFLCWLLCLVKIGTLTLPDDAPALVLRIFWRYIEVMRVIQAKYWLEPAGSHGVWGLDDYHFLPFLWGAGQLSTHLYLRPKSIHDADIVDEMAPKAMYYACIRSINSVKTASLRWHSPMLDDISGVRTWSKVNEGMAKMYRAEVLLKLPIAQHILFGSLLDFGSSEDVSVPVEEDGHGHRHCHGEGQAAGWGDCCGIPIPSVFAAAEARGAVRRIPFD